jgi:hypothetical protein
MRACTQCAMGSYAKQTNHSSCAYQHETGAIDYFSCLEGAVSCTQCPSDKPNTYGNGSTDISDCKKCASGKYETNTATVCRSCTPKCSEWEYESVGCTQYTNRMCKYCFQTECGMQAGNPGPVLLFYYCHFIVLESRPSLPQRTWADMKCFWCLYCFEQLLTHLGR